MSYLLFISVVLTLNDIIGWSIFFTGDNNERSNGALNVVYFAIFSSSANIESHHSALRGLFKISPIESGAGVFVGRLISILFYWICICFLKYFFSRYSCLCVIWWHGYNCICLWYVDLRWLPWFSVMLLDILLKCLKSIYCFYFFQVMFIYMRYHLLTRSRKTCCDAHSIGKKHQWDYSLVENLLSPQICHLWWRCGIRYQFIAL